MLDNNAGVQIRRVGMYHVYLAESKYSDLSIILNLIFTNGKVYHGHFTVRICLKVLEDTSELRLYYNHTNMYHRWTDFE
jgi:hypothetical protein